MDKVKLAVAVLLLAGGIAGFYWFEDQYMLLIRVVGLLVVVGVALLVAYQTAVGRQTWAYVGEAKTEVKKVVWPTRKEAFHTTLIIIAVVFVVALFLWLVDTLLMWLMQLLTG